MVGKRDIERYREEGLVLVPGVLDDTTRADARGAASWSRARRA
jgi:hypothetical protein